MGNMLFRISTVILTATHLLSNYVRANVVAPVSNQNTQLKVQDADMGQKMQMANTIANMGIAGTTGSKPGQMNICSGKSIDGAMQQINQQLSQRCVQEKKEKKAQLAEAAKSLVDSKNQCVQKVSPQAMTCHVDREVKKIISESYYMLSKNQNVTEVFEQGNPVLLVVTEKFAYNAKEKETPKTSNFKNSTPVTFKYNRLGGLLSQSGELPQPKKDSPCAACLEMLSKKAESVDGQTESCGGCDSTYLPTNVQGNQFKIQNSSGKEEGKKKGSEKSDEGDN